MSNQNNTLSTFNFQDNSIRTTLIEGKPWFVAKDVCDVLQLSNSRKAITALDDDEKGVTLGYTLGGEQELNIISESGMYALIMRSRKAMQQGTPQHTFRKWVTSEVLPQIRQTGEYKAPQKDKVLGGYHPYHTVIWELLNRFRDSSCISRAVAEADLLGEFGVRDLDDIPTEQIPKALQSTLGLLLATYDNPQANALSDYYQARLERAYQKLEPQLVDDNIMHRAVNYVAQLKLQIKQLGGQVVDIPDLDDITVANALITERIKNRQAVLSFNAQGEPIVNFLHDDQFIANPDSLPTIITHRYPQNRLVKLLSAITARMQGGAA